MKRITPLLLALAVLRAFTIHCQPVHEPAGAAAWMHAGISTLRGNAFSVFNNPSQMSFTDRWQSGVYHQRRFNRSELAVSGIGAVFPNRVIDAGTGLMQYGFTGFSQQRFVFALSKKLAPELSLGIQLNYLFTSMADYGHTGTWLPGAGITYRPAERITLAFTAYNPSQRRIRGHTGDPVPALAVLGIACRLNSKVHTLLEMQQQPAHPLVYRAGVRYEAHKRVTLGAGASSGPAIYTFGCSVKAAATAIDMAAAVHQYLGFTPQLSLRYPAN